MKILYVTNALDVGGAEQHLRILLPRLQARGHEISVFCLSHRGHLAETLEGQGIPVLAPKSGPLRLLKGAVAFYLHLHRDRPDIVHMFLPAAYLVAGWGTFLRRRTRFVMSRRSLNHYQKKHPLAAWIERRLHRHMDLILGNSKAVLADLESEGAPVEKTALIYNGIDVKSAACPHMREETRNALGIPSASLVFIMVANLIGYKGHNDLIDALTKAEMPDGWRVLLVGADRGIRADLESRAKAAGLLEKILFTGLRPDVPALLSAADVGLSCSHEEGFSNAILEMMAAGLPIIATDAGGNAEAVQDEQTGRIVPPKAPDTLAEALEEMTDAVRRVKMGHAARKRVEENFPLSKCVDNYETHYRNLLQS